MDIPKNLKVSIPQNLMRNWFREYFNPLGSFFNAKNIAVVGASKHEMKIGGVIFKRILESIGKCNTNIFPVNPNASFIYGRKSYHSILDIPKKLDMVIIALPPFEVIPILKDAVLKNVKNIIIVSSGFSETGSKAGISLEREIRDIAIKCKLNIIGPNCLGIFDSEGIDMLFLPEFKLKRPKPGSISIISQSGAIGAIIMEYLGVCAKFVSYGNALTIGESEIIQYLLRDEKTRYILLYIEAVKDGRKFLQAAKVAAKKKPIIILKGGVSEAGSRAAYSHTGSIAGTKEVYFGAFKQANLVIANSLKEFCDVGKLFEFYGKPKGNKIAIVTNGGGVGILCADLIKENGLSLAELKKNPIDLLGDATDEDYKEIIEALIKDRHVNVILVNILFQTPMLTPKVLEYVVSASKLAKRKAKQLIVITQGGKKEQQLIKDYLENKRIAHFEFPEQALSAIGKYASSCY